MLQEGQEILEKRYKIIKRLGGGAFGEIFRVEKKKSGEILAAKVEKAVKNQKHIMLYWESKLIHKLRGKTCVPNLHFVGDEIQEDGKSFHVMVMDLLGKSLEDLFQECKRRFDLRTVLCIAIQMIQRIQKVHEERIIHRDIKPDNFLIGGNETNKNNVFIIDFGLAKCYKSSTGEHIPFREGKNLTGTARYASINTHIGYEQSRRDDLETIGHVLLYFLRGSLPWQGLPGRSKNEKYANIKKKKLEVTVDELCKGHPEEFKEFMNYCRKLTFTEDPDYKYILGLFEGCMKKNNWDPKLPDFIWNKNRLVIEKEALKQNLMKIINKPVKKQQAEEEAGEEQKKEPQRKIDKNSIAVNQANQILNQRMGENPKKETKPTVMVGKGIVSGGSKMQQYGDLNQQSSLQQNS